MEVHSISLKGKRPSNEDKHTIILNINNKNKEVAPINFTAVYDGHGGNYVSDYLAKNLPKYFLNNKVQYPLNNNYVNKIYDHLNNSLKRTNRATDCGSTCLVVTQFRYNNQNYINVINTGDSRALLCRGMFNIALTLDHKPAWPAERTRITKLGGVITHDTCDWRIKNLSVSRAFGDFDATPYITHKGELFRYKLDPEDKFLVVACDGVFESLDNSEVVNFILSKCYDATTKVRINKDVNIAKKLAEYAINKGSGDNITCIVIFLA
jgi:serine/threonine protein phosphatase PrpC